MAASELHKHAKTEKPPSPPHSFPTRPSTLQVRKQRPKPFFFLLSLIPAESPSGWYDRCVAWAESPLSKVAISSGLGTFAIGGIAALLQRGFKMAARQPFYANHRAMKLARQPVRLFKLNPSQEVLEQDTELMRKIAAPIVERTSGVMVFATDPGMGKTTTTREVVRQLQEKKKIAGAIYIDCKDVTQMMEECESNKNPYLALRRRLLMDMGIPRDTHVRDNFSSMFSPPHGQRVVMVLDQFELFKNLCEEKHLQNMIKSMALDASQANVHTVVVVVADKDLASAMCTWNNRQKITSLLPEVGAVRAEQGVCCQGSRALPAKRTSAWPACRTRPLRLASAAARRPATSCARGTSMSRR